MQGEVGCLKYPELRDVLMLINKLLETSMSRRKVYMVRVSIIQLRNVGQ